MNSGFLFQDRYWPLTEELSEAHDIITTKKSYILHRKDIQISNFLVKQYKSVQTAYSYTDILATKKLSNVGKFRKTRSQESLPNHRPSSDDVIDWLHDLYYGNNPNVWAEKLKRLADKLNKPGGEERLKKKIGRCVKKIPNPLTDNLSEQILEKIKRLCSRNDKIRMSPEAKRYKVVGSITDRATLKRHIEMWLKTLPIKKKDNSGRIIRKEVILNSILYRLEPFIYRRCESLLDYQNIIKSHIMEIIYDIPIEHDYNKNGEYVKVATDRIVNELIDLNERKVPKAEVKNKQKVDERKITDKLQPTEKDIKDFVTDEITYFLEGRNLTLSESSMVWVERELTDILMEALMHGFESDENFKEDINTVLQDFGNFTEFQAEVFTRKLRKHLRSIFHIVRKIDYELPTFCNYPKHVLVYYDNDDNKTAEKYVCANTKNYFEQLSKEIEEWLLKSNLNHRFKNESSKYFAITQLAEKIIKRHKYLERHPSRKRAENDEAEFLKFQVRKWVRKFISDTDDYVKKAPELTAILKAIPVPLLTTVQEIKKLSNCRNADILERNYVPISKYAKEICEAIYNWYQELPNDICYSDDKKTRKLFIRMLADNIERSIKENSHEEVNKLIAKEVDNWVKRILKCSPKIFLVEELKRRLINIPVDIERDRSEATYTIANNTNIGLEGISDNATYFKAVAREIDEWLTEILPDTKNNVSRRHAVNDLAAEIIDRQKYLNINPSSYVSEYEELETLKYQIYKWINKIIGENNLETIKRAIELKDRIHFLSTPKQSMKIYNNNEVLCCRSKVSNMSTHKSTSEQNYIHNKFTNLSPFTKTVIIDPSLEAAENTYGSEETFVEINKQNHSLQLKRRAEKYKITSIRADCSIQCDSLNTSSNKTSILPLIGRNSEIASQESSTRSSFETKKDSVNYFDTYAIGNVDINNFPANSSYLNIYKINVDSKHRRLMEPNFLSMDEEYSVPYGLSLAKIYEYFETIFKKRCVELPLEATTSEQNQLVEIARQGMYNGIWKTYFKLKSDPNVEYDYTLFEAMLEDKLDAMLDVLPQTPEMKILRQQWKIKVLGDVTKMLEYVHSITEISSLRTLLANNFIKSFARVKNKELNDRLKHLFVTDTVDAFILYSRFKNDGDVLKSNIYKQRLMKKLEELCENIKIEYPAEFGNVNISQLCQEAFKILGTIALPEDEMLRDEAEEILLGDEVQQWYTELPTTMNKTVLNDIVRNRFKVLLIKKLYELEKRSEYGDKSAENKMRREIDKFLEIHAELDKKYTKSCETCHTKQINLLTNILMNRLKSRKQTFCNPGQQGSRRLSNLVEPDPGSIMAPLIDSKLQIRHSLMQQSICVNQTAGNGYTDQVGSCGNTEQVVKPCGYTVQIAGPSTHINQPAQTPVAQTNTGQQCMNVPLNQYLAIVSEGQTQHPLNVNNEQRVDFEADTGTELCNTAPSVNTKVIATNTNAQFENFEDILCPCLEFYHKKRKRLYYGEGRHCTYMPVNCGYSMY